MADLSKIQPGNWLRYIPENQYCTFVSKADYIVVEGYNGQWNCFDDQLTYIRVSVDIFSLCKFIMDGAHWSKTTGAGIPLTISYTDDKPYLHGTDTEAIYIPFVHTLQNAYAQLTGERLQPNLYGVHPS